MTLGRRRKCRRVGWAVPAVLFLVLGSLTVLEDAPRAGASSVTTTITNRGETQYTVPAGAVALTVTLIGDAGEPGENHFAGGSGTGGEGAEVQATIPVPNLPTPDTLFVDIDAGGGTEYDRTGDGGGASDIATCSDCAESANPSTDPRLLVAGGGGGGGDSIGYPGGAGGNAGTSSATNTSGAGGAGVDSYTGDSGTDAGVGSTSVPGIAGEAGYGSDSCQGYGEGAVGQPGSGAVGGGQQIVEYPDMSEGGGGGGGWVGGSGGGGAGCAEVGGGGGGGAGLSYVEGNATDVSVSSTTSAAEVVITALVTQAPSITNADNATFTVQQSGTFTVTTGAGNDPTPSLTVSSGSLPTGVILADNHNGTATLGGTPVAGTSGVYPFVITAYNGLSPDATQTFTLSVEPSLTLTFGEAPAITSAASTSFTVGTAGHFTVTTSGVPTPRIVETGALPTGVTFVDNGNGTAALVGTPAAATGGTYAISLGASNGLLPDRTQSFTLTVSQPRFPTYQLVASDGGIFDFGGAQFLGSTGSIRLNQPIVGTTAMRNGGGYWLVAADGGIFNFGDARFFGSAAAHRLNKPIVGMAATPDGGGYWLVAADGGVYSYGDAPFFGSVGARSLPAPIVGIATTPDGGGYWLVGADGSVYPYGDARSFGSPAALSLSAPIVGMAITSDGAGYWLVGADGGVYSYGDAAFFGSTGALRLNKPVVGMAPTPDGRGYWLVASEGGIFAYGDAAYSGSEGGQVLNAPVVAMSSG